MEYKWLQFFERVVSLGFIEVRFRRKAQGVEDISTMWIFGASTIWLGGKNTKKVLTWVNAWYVFKSKKDRERMDNNVVKRQWSESQRKKCLKERKWSVVSNPTDWVK